jgi:hypothetical protein
MAEFLRHGGRSIKKWGDAIVLARRPLGMQVVVWTVGAKALSLCGLSLHPGPAGNARILPSTGMKPEPRWPPPRRHPLRTRQRAELNCQIVHDSIHRREGGRCPTGSTLRAGGLLDRWPLPDREDRPTLFEFYVLPPARLHAFDLFEALLWPAARVFECRPTTRC